jgi:hypothetical protein
MYPHHSLGVGVGIGAGVDGGVGLGLGVGVDASEVASCPILPLKCANSD